MSAKNRHYFPIVVEWQDDYTREMIYNPSNLDSQRSFRVLATRVTCNHRFSTKQLFKRQWGIDGKPRDVVRAAEAAWDSGFEAGKME